MPCLCSDPLLELPRQLVESDRFLLPRPGITDTQPFHGRQPRGQLIATDDDGSYGSAGIRPAEL